jgi:hypothetical protein
MGRAILLMLIINNLVLGSVAIVKKTTGKVEVKRKKSIIVIKVGSSLENGDIIMTKSKSSIGITFDDGSRLSLGSKAIFVINKFIVKPSKKKYNVDLELKRGKAMFNSGKIGKLSPKSVKFRIPEGAIGIRGTKFIVEVK